MPRLNIHKVSSAGLRVERVLAITRRFCASLPASPTQPAAARLPSRSRVMPARPEAIGPKESPSSGSACSNAQSNRPKVRIVIETAPASQRRADVGASRGQVLQAARLAAASKSTARMAGFGFKKTAR